MSNSSAKERLQKAFDETVQALATHDVPLLMHSAGDTLTPDPQTVQLVAALTVQYMGRLVDAALDAREILHPDIGRTIPPLPPPALRTTTPTHHHATAPTKRKTHSEFWDDPLPAPKIRRRDEGAAPLAPAPTVDAHEWVGVAGVDLWQHRRARAVYVSHGALTRHQFLFPLCHDSYVYGRIRAVQAKKMAEFVPLLQDTVLHETVEAEGELMQQQQKEQHRRWRKQQHQQQQTAADPHNNNATKHNKPSDGKQAKRDESGNNSDPEEEESDSDAESKSEDEGDGPSFPGMDTFLPAYRTFGSNLKNPMM